MDTRFAQVDHRFIEQDLRLRAVASGVISISPSA
jgi:hypothetical protein